MALSVEDLRAFTVVASERSVTRAAQRLGVTQQSVSERVRRLERRLGVELFMRLPHGMQPSSAGFRLLPLAQQSVALIDRAMSVVNDDDLVRLRVHRTVAPVVTPFLDDAVEGARVDVAFEDDPDPILDAIAEGAADVGIGVFTDLPIQEPGLVHSPTNGSGAREPGGKAADPSAGVAEADGSEPAAAGDDKGDATASTDATADVFVEPLFVDPVVWAAPPDHPLATSERPVSMLDLSRYPMALSIDEKAAMPSTGGADGEGLRVATRSMIASAIDAGVLVEIAVDQPSWVLPVSIAYRSSDHDRPALAALRDAIVEAHARSQARDARSRSSIGARP